MSESKSGTPFSSGSEAVTSESEPAMSEEEEGDNAAIPRQLALDSRSPSEEIFSFDTRGRTELAKKKRRIETFKTTTPCASNVATKKHVGKCSVARKKSLSGSQSQKPRSRSLSAGHGILATPSPRLNSGIHGGSSTVPQTEPKKRMLPGYTPNTRNSGQSASSTQEKPDSPQQSDCEQDDLSEQPIKSVLGEISKMLGTVIKRLDRTESKLESMERRLDNIPSFSGSSSEPVSKKKVPQVVRTETRMMYKTLMDCDDEFVGFDTSAETTYKHPSNQNVTNILLKEVKTNNPTYSTDDIRAASYTYYKSLCQEESLKRKGTYQQRKTQRRRRERLSRRLEERLAEFKLKSYSDADRMKWGKILTSDLVSSDESDIDENDKAVLVVKELGWRNDRVTTFFAKLDSAHEDRKSEQAKRQTKSRIRKGVMSTREAPAHLPSWASCY